MTNMENSTPLSFILTYTLVLPNEAALRITIKRVSTVDDPDELSMPATQPEHQEDASPQTENAPPLVVTIPTGSNLVEVSFGKQPQGTNGRTKWRLEGRSALHTASREHCIIRLHRNDMVEVKDCSLAGTFICKNFKEEDDKKLWTRTTKGTWTTVPRFSDMDIACMFMACNPTPLGITPPIPSTPPSSSSAAEHGNKNKRRENYGQGKSSYAKKRRARQSNQQRQHSGHQAGGKTCPSNSGTSSFVSQADVERLVKAGIEQGIKMVMKSSVSSKESKRRVEQARKQGNVQGRRQVKAVKSHQRNRSRQNGGGKAHASQSYTKNVKECRDFKRDGRCHRGNKCNFAHISKTKINKRHNPRQANKRKRSKDMREFHNGRSRDKRGKTSQDSRR